MFDDTVLSQHDPPKKEWLVVITGHHEEVEPFVKEILHLFKDLDPEALFDGDDDEMTVTVRMIWNSIGLENMLMSIRPDHVRVIQRRGDEACQDPTT